MYTHSDPIQESRSRSAGESIEKEVRSPGTSLAPPVLSLKASPIQRNEMPEEEELQMKVNPLQRQEPEEEELQMKAEPLQRQEPEEEELQMKKSASPIQRSAGSGSSMPEDVQTQMEDTFQADFSSVKIHDNSESAPAVGALAYTQGNDIHFSQGQYDPSSSKGQELLGHELTHVVQQREGRVQATTEISGMPVNDDHSLENEADQMGQKAAQQKIK